MDRPVLQGGELHRGRSRRLRGLPPERPHRGRRAAVASVLLAVAGALLVGVDGHDAHRAHQTPAVAVRPQPIRAAKPPGDPYGALPAPPGQRVNVRFRHPPRSGLLFDLRTGKVLWAWASHRTLPIASVTKMMTGLLVAERSEPTERVLITRTALAYQGSGVGLLPRGKLVPLEPLLYGLLLPSGNDAAIALAQHVAGSVPRFAALMNARARKLGMRCSYFVGPDGYDDANRSCVRDLALLTRAFLHQARLARIVAMPSAALPFPIKGGKLYLATHNPLMRLGYRWATGVKTGFSDAAGLCFVGTARRGHLQLGVVLLNSPQPGGQAMRLLDAGFGKLSLSAEAVT